MKQRIILTYLGIMVMWHGIGEAAEEMFYKEVDIVGGYSTVDNWKMKKAMSQNSSAGFEYYRKYSNDYGDFMTVDLQARFAYDLFEKFDDAWSVEIHNAWAEYKLGLGHSLRAGHYDPAFGLEPILDTHGTLFQTLAGRNIGFKKDWGVEYRGIIGEYDYELSAQLGSGMSIERKDGSMLFTGRIGSDSAGSFNYGASVLYGKVLQPDGNGTFPKPSYNDKAIEKKRIGLDAVYSPGAFNLKGEIAFGQDDDDEVIGGMAEVDYILPFLQAATLKVQTQLWDSDLNNKGTLDAAINAGISYEVNSNITLRLAYFHDLDRTDGKRDRQIILQFYFFGL